MGQNWLVSHRHGYRIIMLMPPFNLYFEIFCQDLKHHFLTAGTDLSCGTLELFAPSSEDEACSRSACAAVIYVIARMRLRGKLSPPHKMMSFQLSCLPGLFAVSLRHRKEQIAPLEAAPQQLLSHVLLCEGSVRELEAVCPRNYIKVCRADLLNMNPATHKRSLTHIGFRIHFDFLLPRTIPMPRCRQICTVGKAIQTSVQSFR